MEENALSEMSFHGVDQNFSSVGTGDSALEHRRWLEFGLGTNAHTSGTDSSRRRRQPSVVASCVSLVFAPKAETEFTDFSTTREAVLPSGSAGSVKDWGCHASTPQSPMATAPLTGEPEEKKK